MSNDLIKRADDFLSTDGTGIHDCDTLVRDLRDALLDARTDNLVVRNLLDNMVNLAKSCGEIMASRIPVHHARPPKDADPMYGYADKSEALNDGFTQGHVQGVKEATPAIGSLKTQIKAWFDQLDSIHPNRLSDVDNGKLEAYRKVLSLLESSK